MEDVNRAMIPAFTGSGGSTIHNTSSRSSKVIMNVYPQRVDPVSDSRGAAAMLGGI